MVIPDPAPRCIPVDACVYGGPQVTGIELAWTILNGLAFLITIAIFLGALRDYRTVRRGQNGVRRRYVFGAVRQQGILAAVQGIFAGVGVVALFLPAPILRPVHDAGEDLALLLILASVLLLGLSVGEWADRRFIGRAALRPGRRK